MISLQDFISLKIYSACFVIKITARKRDYRVMLVIDKLSLLNSLGQGLL